MSNKIPEQLENDINRAVLSYVADSAAHSDIAEALQHAIEPLGDVKTFCPDVSAYMYEVVYTSDVIFGFAIGMNTIGFRLNSVLRDRALQTGGIALSEVGPEWVIFSLFRDDWPEVDLKFWARKAYLFARETVS